MVFTSFKSIVSMQKNPYATRQNPHNPREIHPNGDLLIHHFVVPLLRWRRLFTPFDKSKFEPYPANDVTNRESSDIHANHGRAYGSREQKRGGKTQGRAQNAQNRGKECNRAEGLEKSHCGKRRKYYQCGNEQCADKIHRHHGNRTHNYGDKSVVERDVHTGSGGKIGIKRDRKYPVVEKNAGYKQKRAEYKAKYNVRAGDRENTLSKEICASVTRKTVGSRENIQNKISKGERACRYASNRRVTADARRARNAQEKHSRYDRDRQSNVNRSRKTHDRCHRCRTEGNV